MQYDETSVSDASQNVARSLQDLTEAARGVAATSPDDRQSQQRMLDSVKEVVERSAFLVDNVREAFGQPGQAHQSRLVDAARQVAEALDRCLKCLPDRTKGLTNALRTINEYSTTRLTTQVTIYPPGRAPATAPGSLCPETLMATIAQECWVFTGDVHMQLNEAASYLNEAAGEVASSTFGPAEQLGAAGDRYSDAYKNFVETTMTIVTTETVSGHRYCVVSSVVRRRFSSLAGARSSRRDCPRIEGPLCRFSTSAAAGPTNSRPTTRSADEEPAQRCCQVRPAIVTSSTDGILYAAVVWW